ncbi:helix-turn-helix domain-containing protein [Rhodopirellula sp. P2]|nr:helix-turn-helix domain-containing protein [Rhodopirellula sp. P2]WDQ16312.1 helix-turn-helix domain-containing protein [Rhodopirellula sp. P2]
MDLTIGRSIAPAKYNEHGTTIEQSVITDIAFEVGFSDSNYFSRQFRTHLGLSPREYRKQMR